MTVTRVAKPNPGANRESWTGADVLHPKVLQRELAKHADAAGLALHPARVRQIVARFIAARGRCDIDNTVGIADYLRLIYADPTGDEAVRNITHGRRPR